MKPTEVAASASKPTISWRSVSLLTAGALALFLTVRLLPTGTNLNHMDFRASGKNVIEFCDPSNPQFIPVVNVRSPVVMKLEMAGPVTAGTEVTGIARLATANGKPIAPVDLAVMHTRKLHLLIVDPTLTDYQHVHPEPTRTPGEWTFSFKPKRSDSYRVFADFTPMATGRGLYAFADVGSPNPLSGVRGGSSIPSIPAVEDEGYLFSLFVGDGRIRAGQPAELHFGIRSLEGGSVPMEPVMGAFAHLVAFDEDRQGFAHLHPNQADPLAKPDAIKPAMDFKITIPSPGRYVIWAQTMIGGKELFVPFSFEVAE